jgi:nucleoside-diphosphate-sugar epimerase
MPTAFLTGATGLIGGETCRLLLERGWRVIALVRSDSAILGNDGQVLASNMLTRLKGDIGQQACGLDRAVQEQLVGDVDLVIHCAASTAFNASDDHYHRINVAGTAHVLALGGTAPFLHISTAYVCGTQNGPIAESACPANAEFANGYERSKAKAEALVEQSGRPWLIARPSIVVGSAIDGRIRRFDSIYGAFKLLAEGRVTSLPATPGASLNFVPIDYVAKAIAALADHHGRFAGEHVHLCAQHALSVVGFVEAMAAHSGLCSPALVNAHSFSSLLLPKYERLLVERVLKYYLSYFQRNPEFETHAAFRLSGLGNAVLDKALLTRLIEYAINSGFLTPRSANARRDNGRPAARAHQVPT